MARRGRSYPNPSPDFGPGRSLYGPAETIERTITDSVSAIDVLTEVVQSPTPPVDPFAAVLEAITADSTRIIRRVDIYEEDAETLWLGDAQVKAGNISVDSTRDERRTLDMTLVSENGNLKSYPGGFWYDKVLKVYRGVELLDGSEWVRQVGEFQIDTIDEADFPSEEVAIAGRDYTAKLLADKFPEATAFGEGQSVSAVIQTIATNGGITKFSFENLDHFLGADTFFDADTSRWEAITTLATNFGLDVFFNGAGYLVLREFRDPAGKATSFVYHTGDDGTIGSFRKRTSGARLYNHVVVVGEKDGTPVVTAVAENTNPASPTCVQEIGRRTYRYVSSFITTQAQADSVAASFLAIHSLEDFENDLETLVIPWLEAGDVIDFVDPDPAPGDPSRMLLSSYTVPYELGLSSVIAKRVTIVQ